jgi:hypothetical protein
MFSVGTPEDQWGTVLAAAATGSISATMLSVPMTSFLMQNILADEDFNDA